MYPVGGAIARSSEAPLNEIFKQRRTNAIAVAPCRKISINVTMKHVTKSISVLLISRCRATPALALAIGIGTKNEFALEYCTQNGMQCMVNDPVSKRRYGNDLMLGVNYFCFPVASRLAGFALKLALKHQYLMLLIGEKISPRRTSSVFLWPPDSMHQGVPKTKRYCR